MRAPVGSLRVDLDANPRYSRHEPSSNPFCWGSHGIWSGRTALLLRVVGLGLWDGSGISVLKLGVHEDRGDFRDSCRSSNASST